MAENELLKNLGNVAGDVADSLSKLITKLNFKNAGNSMTGGTTGDTGSGTAGGTPTTKIETTSMDHAIAAAKLIGKSLTGVGPTPVTKKDGTPVINNDGTPKMHYSPGYKLGQEIITGGGIVPAVLLGGGLSFAAREMLKRSQTPTAEKYDGLKRGVAFVGGLATILCGAAIGVNMTRGLYEGTKTTAQQNANELNKQLAEKENAVFVPKGAVKS